MNDQSESRFRRFGILTIAAVFFLILVGGLVRSTGSGMGCPDWPKCFGTWVPPTDVNQLPADYKEIYRVGAHEIADFDVYKTWIEYINRLIGVVIGFFIFLTMFFAIPYLKKDKTVFYLSLIAFILVGFQGWIGSRVVSSNLAHWMITIHMLIALLIVGILIYTITRSQNFFIEQKSPNHKLKIYAVLLLVLGLFQTVSGTQIREAVDIMDKLNDGANRNLWIDGIITGNLTKAYDFGNYGITFLMHRSSSLLNMLLVILLFTGIKKVFDRNSVLYRSLLAIILLVALQIFSGKVLEIMGLPKYVQSLHLFIGSLIMGGYLYVCILLFTKVKVTK
jgi:cytochrome c oxidase assembly protein subunit 15